MSLPKMINDAGPLPDRRDEATRREFFSVTTVLVATTPARGNSTSDPIIALIAEEQRWRLLAIAARARAEKHLFALPKNKWPDDFDDHPSMREALLLEERADEVYGRILSTSAGTVAGILAKLEWGDGDSDTLEAAIIDLRRWVSQRS